MLRGVLGNPHAKLSRVMFATALCGTLKNYPNASLYSVSLLYIGEYRLVYDIVPAFCYFLVMLYSSFGLSPLA